MCYYLHFCFNVIFSFSFSVCDINMCLRERHIVGGSEWDSLRMCSIADCPFNGVEPRFILPEKYVFVMTVMNENSCMFVDVLIGALCVIITKKRCVFKADCPKLQPHVVCNTLRAVDCNLQLVTADQTCINMFISSQHDNCARPRACYTVMMFVLNSHLLHCLLLLDSLTRGPARSTCTVSVVFIVLTRDACADNYIMSFRMSVCHPFRSRWDRWPSKGSRLVAGLYTSFLTFRNRASYI
jgi:hypothetical protein